MGKGVIPNIMKLNFSMQKPKMIEIFNQVDNPWRQNQENRYAEHHGDNHGWAFHQENRGAWRP
jgi:hypothetical protein